MFLFHAGSSAVITSMVNLADTSASFSGGQIGTSASFSGSPTGTSASFSGTTSTLPIDIVGTLKSLKSCRQQLFSELEKIAILYPQKKRYIRRQEYDSVLQKL